jgi:hypothetical protein
LRPVNQRATARAAWQYSPQSGGLHPWSGGRAPPGLVLKIDERHRKAVCVLDDEGGVPVDLREGETPVLLEFIFFKVHINSEFGGVPMPLSDSNVARCVVCVQIMDKWDSTRVPTFKLVHRPEDH